MMIITEETVRTVLHSVLLFFFVILKNHIIFPLLFRLPLYGIHPALSTVRSSSCAEPVPAPHVLTRESLSL